MPRVTTVKSARKDQGKCGHCGVELPKGRPYRHWSFRYSGIRKRCMRPECDPRGSDLTSNDKLSRLLAAKEAIEDLELPDLGDLASSFQSSAEEAREVAEEYRESASAMEDGLGTSTEMTMELEERGDAAETWADQLDEIAEALNSIDFEDALSSFPDF